MPTIYLDCDGVLVDSEIIAAQVESRLLTEAGYPISVEEMGERFAGMTWKNILLQVEQEADIPLSASLLDKSEKLLDQRLERSVKIIDGVKFALARLTTQRCICSNSSSQRLDMMLNDCMYGIIFRDINPRRTFVDQRFSRQIHARAGIVITRPW